MDLLRADELLPVWIEDENDNNTSAFDSFWPMASDNDSTVNDAIFVEQAKCIYNGWNAQMSDQDNYLCSNSESFSTSTDSEQEHEEMVQQQQMQLSQPPQLPPREYNQDLHVLTMQYMHVQPYYVSVGEYPVHPSSVIEDEGEIESEANACEMEPTEQLQYEQNDGSCTNPNYGTEEDASLGGMDVDDPVDFKLPASKTPIMEAMVVCAINGWGLSVMKSTPMEVIFRVTDFDRYYRVSRAICSKHRPTEDIGSRVKSLRRWFVNFPKKKDRQENPNFLLSVKPNTCKKVHGLIERNMKLLNKKNR